MANSYAKLRYDRIMDQYRVGSGTRFVMADAGGNVDSSIAPRIRVAKAGTLVGTRSRLNLIEGSNVTITAADDSAGDEIDVTIASSGGGGGGGDDAGILAATAPPTSGWSWVNQGSSTIAQNAFGSLTLVPQTQSGFNARMYVRSFPSAPFQLDFLMAHYPSNVSSSLPGWCVRESGTGKIVSYVIADNSTFLATQWGSPTSFTGNYVTTVSRASAIYGCVARWRLIWGATNREIWVSFSGWQNAGDGWQLHSVAKNDGATTAFDEFGLFTTTNFSAAAGTEPVTTLMSYVES